MARTAWQPAGVPFGIFAEMDSTSPGSSLAGPDKDAWLRDAPDPEDCFRLHHGDVLDVYESWPAPDCVVVDGPYGVGGFFGDPRTPDRLADWYRPHVEMWSKLAKLSSTLWFWGTEIGWATVHPLLDRHGWEYVQTVHWNKGISHAAGNVNSKTIRRFPVVNEIVVFYTRRFEFDLPGSGEPMPARQWLRAEWDRTGLPRREANDACGVKDAATRKWFTQSWLWYPPPPAMMQRLVDWANLHGDPAGKPYYSLDGHSPVTGDQWATLRYRWQHTHGLTNVWDHPPLHGRERLKNLTGRRHAPRVHNPAAGVASAHLNQKPLDLMRRILHACTQPGDTIWEPFGGLCTVSVAAVELGRFPCAAEVDPHYADLAQRRLQGAADPVAAAVTAGGTAPQRDMSMIRHE